MLERTQIFVDTSYLLASFYNSWENGARAQLEIDLPEVVTTLKTMAQNHLNQPVHRQFWYDGIPDSGPHRYQRALRTCDGVQLRAGQLIEWGERRTQKAVDTRLVADLVLVGLRRDVTDIILVSGDADMIPGVQEAVNAGVRVHLYGFGWDSMSSALRHNCDSTTILDPREDFAECMQLQVLEGPLPPVVRGQPVSQPEDNDGKEGRNPHDREPAHETDAPGPELHSDADASGSSEDAGSSAPDGSTDAAAASASSPAQPASGQDAPNGGKPAGAPVVSGGATSPAAQRTANTEGTEPSENTEVAEVIEGQVLDAPTDTATQTESATEQTSPQGNNPETPGADAPEPADGTQPSRSSAATTQHQSTEEQRAPGEHRKLSRTESIEEEDGPNSRRIKVTSKVEESVEVTVSTKGAAEPKPKPRPTPNPSMMAPRRKLRSRYVPLPNEVWTSAGYQTPFDVGQQYARWWYESAATSEQRDSAHLLSGGGLPPEIDRPLLQFACETLHEYTLTESQRVGLRDGFHAGIRGVLVNNQD